MDREDLALLREKHAQLDTLLANLDADCWIVYCREGRDPSSWLLVGYPMVGESAFIFTSSGRKYALVAGYDAMAIEELKLFDRIIVYGQEGIDQHLRDVISELSPKRIMLNFSESDFLADGLTLGMFRKLVHILGGSLLEDRLVSSEPILSRLRARKTPEEIRRIRKAIVITEDIFADVAEFAKPGMTEREICDFIEERQREYGVTPVGDVGAAVCTGRVGIGHRQPGEHPLVPGDTVSIDMGVYFRGYCSDVTRTFYILRAGESRPPTMVRKRFDLVVEAVHQAIQAVKPGKRGYEIDQVARDFFNRHGLEPYPHALGHQIGRFVHDGAGALAPLVPRYGDRGRTILEPGNVYTIEPFLYSYPPIGLEEDILVTEHGAKILTKPQKELILIGE